MSGIEASQAVEPWVDAKTIAQHLGFKHDHVRALARAGKLPGVPTRNGTRDFWRFKISQVDEFMNQQANVSRIACRL
jgi:excisionase family DNA binding protein